MILPLRLTKSNRLKKGSAEKMQTDLSQSKDMQNALSNSQNEMQKFSSDAEYLTREEGRAMLEDVNRRVEAAMKRYRKAHPELKIKL